jgi:hypothetical protein
MTQTNRKAICLLAIAAVLIFPQVNYSSPIYTSIELSEFAAVFDGSKVKVSWKTETEINNSVFNILRAEAEAGLYVQINGSTIAAQGSPFQGATYEFVDTDVQNGKTYYYKLVDITEYGTATEHGPVSVDVPLSTSTSTTTTVIVDTDGDDVPDYQDNCPTVYNPDQADIDLDGIGDVCDYCQGNGVYDTDNDGHCDLEDNCPTTCNPQQLDADGDGIGDLCDDPNNDGCGGCGEPECEQACS